MTAGKEGGKKCRHHDGRLLTFIGTSFPDRRSGDEPLSSKQGRACLQDIVGFGCAFTDFLEDGGCKRSLFDGYVCCSLSELQGGETPDLRTDVVNARAFLIARMISGFEDAGLLFVRFPGSPVNDQNRFVVFCRIGKHYPVMVIIS